MKLHIKYQRPVHSGFSLEDFKGFPYVSLCKTCWPLGGANFLPQGYNLNNLGRSTLDKA